MDQALKLLFDVVGLIALLISAGAFYRWKSQQLGEEVLARGLDQCKAVIEAKDRLLAGQRDEVNAFQHQFERLSQKLALAEARVLELLDQFQDSQRERRRAESHLTLCIAALKQAGVTVPPREED